MEFDGELILHGDICTYTSSVKVLRSKGEKDNQQPSTSRGSGGSKQEAEKTYNESPEDPKIIIIRGTKHVIGLEGSVAQFSFESNVPFSRQDLILIEWFVGRGSFKDQSRIKKTLSGTMHTIRAILDLSMDGPILANVYKVKPDCIQLLYRIWSWCHVIPLQDYTEQTPEQRPTSPERLRSQSAETHRSRPQRTDCSPSTRYWSPSPVKKSKSLIQMERNSSDCKRDFRPFVSFNVYKNFPENLIWKQWPTMQTYCYYCESRNNQKIFSSNPYLAPPSTPEDDPQQIWHDNQRAHRPVAEGSPRRRRLLPSPHHRGSSGGSPRRMLPAIPVTPQRHWREHMHNSYGHGSPERQRQRPPAERVSRQPERCDRQSQTTSNDSSPYYPVDHVRGRMQHSRPRSLSVPRFDPCSDDEGINGICEKCATKQAFFRKMLHRGKELFCCYLCVWYSFVKEYKKFSYAIQKMNRENR